MNKECNLLGVQENAETFEFLLPQMNPSQVRLSSTEWIITKLLWKRNGGRVDDQEGTVIGKYVEVRDVLLLCR